MASDSKIKFELENYDFKILESSQDEAAVGTITILENQSSKSINLSEQSQTKPAIQFELRGNDANK